MPESSFMQLRELYPPLNPNRSFHLDVGDGHLIYVEECGNPAGVPIVFVHGGPGGGISGLQRRFFDPTRFRIILFDQRGCGRSQPHASLHNNTSQHLVADMEKIRRYIGLDKWVLFGGSWGSTLSILYAETHPERCLSLILRGVFLATREELDWFYGGGTGAIFPESWHDFVSLVPENERSDLIGAYYKRLTVPEFEKERLIFAKAWSLWEGSTVSLIPDIREARQSIDPNFALAFARIEAHYFINNCFMRDNNQLLSDAYKIGDIPVHIVQGRYDAICPPLSAYKLDQHLGNCQLTIVPAAGHSAFEPGIRHELICVSDQVAGQF